MDTDDGKKLTLENENMMSFETFCEIAEEEAALLPEYAYDELEGGVLADPGTYLHPKRVEDDLYILGTYSRELTGRKIVLYYGSFKAVMGNASEEEVRKQIRDTLRHEFRHHLESRAGLYFGGTLIEEDRDSMIRYYMRHKN